MRNTGLIKRLFILVLIGTILSACELNTKETIEKPNIIIFFTDDQGYADVGCFGAEGFVTPNLDKLATDGIRFTDFYVAAGVCTPSRAALLTGRYPKRYNLHESVVFPYNEHGLPPHEVTMAEMLKSVGYSTACVGKWHLGHFNLEFMPNNQGFDYYFGVPYSNDMDKHYYKQVDFQAPPLPVYLNEEMVDEGPDQKYLTRTFTDEAINFIKREKEKPFFLYLPHCMPHAPLHASESFKGKSDLGLYGDVIMELDWSAGEIVKVLKEQGLYENTIVIFTSDNGPRLGSAKPLRGKKATTWEGGQRVPAIISWPDKIPQNVVCSEVISAMDLFPTLAHLTGADVSMGLQLDGDNILDLLKEPESHKLEERPFYFYGRNGKPEAVRLGKWKLHIAKQKGWGWKNEEPFPVSLYNLETDKSEKENLAKDHPEIVERLSAMITEFDAKL